MTDKRIMKQHEREFLENFRHACAGASNDNYTHYLNSEAAKPTPNSINFLGKLYKLLADYYGAIHSRNKTESISYYKKIKQQQAKSRR